MTNAATVRRQIEHLTVNLIEIGFADDQNLPFIRDLGQNRSEVSYYGAHSVDVLGDEPYRDLYARCRAERNFNLLLLDGGLVQMNYEFERDDLRKLRAAFLPSPTFESFQNEPELYTDDVFFVDILEKQVIAVPLRFDFDDRQEVVREVEHPRSHLTLGQYSRCRIPATSAIMPYTFVQFVLRSFYNTAFSAVAARIPNSPERFKYCSCSAEREVVHVGVPSMAAETG